MESKDKLIGGALILLGIGFIVLGVAFGMRPTTTNQIYTEQQNNVVYTENGNENEIQNYNVNVYEETNTTEEESEGGTRYIY